LQELNNLYSPARVLFETFDSFPTVFKSRLKTFLFNQTFTEHWSDLPPAPLKLRPYGAMEIRLLLLLLLLLLCQPRDRPTGTAMVMVYWCLTSL